MMLDTTIAILHGKIEVVTAGCKVKNVPIVLKNSTHEISAMTDTSGKFLMTVDILGTYQLIVKDGICLADTIHSITFRTGEGYDVQMEATRK
jgi:hypothetical protein